MDSLSHYHLSQEYAAKAGQILKGWGGEVDLVEASAFAALAQVHATLALAAVTALRGTHPDGQLPLADANAWFETVAHEAPIPPETDDEDDAVRLGSVSPTDPAALGEWLRDRPDGTIFQGAKGLGWQLNVVAVTSFLVAPYTYRALTSTAGEEFRIDGGDIDLAALATAAPFTVLALGEQAGRTDG